MKKTNKIPDETKKEDKKKTSMKDKEEEDKKDNLSQNTSEKTLDRILSSKRDKFAVNEDSEISSESDEESEPISLTLNEFAKPRERRNTSLDRIALSSGRGIRIDSGWENESEEERKKSKGSNFEYIPKNNEESAGKNYQSYEVNPNTKIMNPEEIASSWSKPFTKMKNPGFIYELKNNAPKYENVFMPKNVDDTEKNKLNNKKTPFEFEEKKMNYNTSK